LRFLSAAFWLTHSGSNGKKQNKPWRNTKKKKRQRPPLLPNLPTVAEQGLAGFDSSSWVALVTPSKTPPAVVAKLRADVDKVIKSPDIVNRLSELGSLPGLTDDQQVRKFLADETKKWAEVIRVSGAKAD
jgi:tripartite-type tricarboxylate transporter receptor subunit TctC